MARPTDWSALDLDDDPTPGDPDRLEQLLEAQQQIIELAADIDDGLDELMKENSSYFIGDTADALREEMDNRVRKFVQSFRDAHQSVHDALTTYHGVMVTQQGIAASALTAADGLDKEDSEWEEHRTTARNAGEALKEAATTAANAVSAAGSDISSMIDPCEEFWKFLTYFVLALILPAIILGGPTALLFLTLSAVLMVKTAIDFAGGRASVTELVLSVLGMLVPTTRGLNVSAIFKAASSWTTRGWTKLTQLTFRQIMVGMTRLPVRFTVATASVIGGIIVTTVKGVGQLIRGGSWVDNAIFRGLGGPDGFAGYVAAHFRGMGPAAILLPVNVGEMGARTWSLSGLGGAFKISLYNRGVLNQYRTGAILHGSQAIDIRAIHGFDSLGRPMINTAAWARYQPGAAATGRFLGGMSHALDDISTAPVITLGSGFTPPSTPNASVVDLSLTNPAPGTGSTISLIGPGTRSPIPTPNASLTDLSLTNPAPGSGFAPPGSTTINTPTGAGAIDLSLGDMRPVSPISVHMADQGTRMGVPDLAPAGGLGSVDGGVAHLPGDLYVAPPPSVVAHLPAPGGQTVGVQMPLLSQAPTVAPPAPATAAPVTGAPTGSVASGGEAVIDVSRGSFTPIRSEVGGLDAARVVTTDAGTGRMPVVNTTGMPQLGEVMTVPSAGVTAPRGETGSLAGTHATGTPVAPVTTVNTTAVPGAGVGRPAGGEVATGLTPGSVPPLRVGFADQGMGLAAPDASQIGAGARQLTDLLHPGAVEGAPLRGADRPPLGGATPQEATLGATPPPRASGDLGGTGRAVVDLGETAAGTTRDVPLARPLGNLPHAGGEAPAPARSLAPPPTPAAPTAEGGVAPVRQPGVRAGAPEGGGALVGGVAPVRLEAIAGRSGAPADGIAAAVPPPVPRGGGEVAPGARPAGEGPVNGAANGPGSANGSATGLVPGAGGANGSGTAHGSGAAHGVVPVESIAVTQRVGPPASPPPPAPVTAVPPPAAVSHPPAHVPPAQGAFTAPTAPPTPSPAAPAARGAGEAELSVHRTGPLAGHAVLSQGGQPPRLLGLDGQPAAGASVTRLGELGWAVTPAGAARGALVDASGARTHDVVTLRGADGEPTGGLVAVPRDGGGEALLLGRGGELLPEPARVVGDSLAVRRAPGTVDFHTLDGGPLGSAHRLPGPEGHELMTPAGAGRTAHVAGPDGRPLPDARVSRFGDDGWLVERPGHRAVVVDRHGGHTHDAFRLTERGDGAWTLAVPPGGRGGAPLLLRDEGAGSVAAVGGGSATRLGGRGFLVQLGEGPPRLVDDTGRVTDAVRLHDRNGRPTELVYVPPTGTGHAGAVYRGDGRLLTDDVLSGFDGHRIVVRTGATQTVHGPDGALLGSGAARPGGPLGAGNRLEFPADGGPARVVGADGAPVSNASVTALGDGGLLVRVPGQRPGVVDATGAHTHDVIPLRGADGAPHGLATMPLRDGVAPAALRPDGTPARGVALTHRDGALLVGREGAGTFAVYDLAGRFTGVRHVVAEGALAGHRVTLVPGAGGHLVLDPAGRTVAGARVTRFGDELAVVEAPGAGRVLLDGSGRATHDVVPVPGGRFVALPAGSGRTAAHDAAWPDGAALRREHQDGSAEFLGADGAVLGRSTPVAEGPLAGRVLLTPEGGVPRLLDGAGRPVPETTVTRLATGDHLVATGGAHHLIEAGGAAHRVVPLTGRPGGPDLFAVVRADGTVHPFPRAADGTTLPDHRVEPRPGAGGADAPPSLTVHTPDRRAVSFDAGTGRFRSDDPGAAGMNRIDVAEYRRLGPADQALVRARLAERPAGPPALSLPGLEHLRSVEVRHMRHGGSSSAPRLASFDLPGLEGARLRLLFDPATGRVTSAAVGQPTGGPRLTAHHEAGPEGDVVRVVRDGETVHTERWVPVAADLRLRLTGGGLTAHRVDPAGTMTVVDDAATPLADGSGFHVALPTGHFAVDHAGARTHAVLPLGPPGGAARDHLFTPVGGGPALLLDAAGRPRAGDLTLTADTVTVRRGNTGDVHDLATGALRERVHHLWRGQWSGHEVRVPHGAGATARPTLVPPPGRPAVHATVDVLTDGRFRVTPHAGDAVVIGLDGGRQAVSVPLRRGPAPSGEHVVVPDRPAPGEGARLEAADGSRVAGATVERVADGFEVRRLGQPHTVTAHGADGDLTHVAQRVRGGTAFDGHWLVTPRAGAPRLAGPDARGATDVRVVDRGDDGLLLLSDDAVAGVTRAGTPADVPLPLARRDGTASDWTLHTPTRPGETPRAVNGVTHEAVTGGNVRIVGGAIEVRRGETAALHGADGALLRETHRVRDAGDLDGADLVVPNTPGAGPRLERAGAPVAGSSVTPLGAHGHLVRVPGRQVVLDDTGRLSHRVVETTLPDGTDGLVAWAQRPGGTHFFTDAHGQLQPLGVTFNPALPDRFTLTRGGAAFEYRAQAGPGGGFTAQLLRETHPVTGGTVPGRTLVIPHDGQPPRLHTPGAPPRDVVPQHWAGFDGYRFAEGPGAPHTVVDRTGQVTHTALPLTPRAGAADPFDAFVLRPAAGPGGPVLRAANGADHTADLAVAGGRFTVTDTATGVSRTHGPDGRFVEERLTVHGGPLNGHRLRLPDDLGQARVTAPGATHERSVTAVVQRDGTVRVSFGRSHVVVDPATGNATHRVIPLTRPGGTSFAFVRQADDQLLPTPRAADGAQAVGDTVTRLPGGDLLLRRAGNPVVGRYDGATGALQHEMRALTGGDAATAGAFVRVHEMTHRGRVYRAYDVLDAHLAVRADRVVTGRQAIPTDVDPGHGFRVRDAAGDRTWVFDGEARLVARIGAPDPATRVRDVSTLHRAAPGGAVTQRDFQVIELGDLAGRRFAEVGGARRVLDADLDPIAGHHLTPRGAGYRYTGDAQGLRAGEYRDYGIDGRLLEQRINIVYRGRRVDGDFYRVVYQHDAAGRVNGGTWEHWRGGNPPPPVAPWLDRGRVDPKGAGQGHVFLLTQNADGLRGLAFERRPQPGGGVLDAHAPGAVAPLVDRRGGVPLGTTQRERWQELDAAGQPVGDGLRIWGTSRRTFYDYGEQPHVSRSLTGPVRHYRETPQGGYVLSVRQSSSGLSFRAGEAGRWYRFDGDLGLQATGDRRWGRLGNGWQDEMPNPRTGSLAPVNAKVSALARHDLRGFRAHELGADGLPGDGFVTVSPQGKEIRTRRTQPDGSWIETHRIAEQRPTNLYRALLSSEFRSMELTTGRGRYFALPHPFLPRENRYAGAGGEAAFVMDSRLQTFEYRTGRGDTVHETGVQVTSSRGYNTVSVSHHGRITGENRPLVNGNTLLVGDAVAPPPGVARQAGYLPWSEGAGKLSGHRTFHAADFVDPPAGSGKARADVVWQDQFRSDVSPNGDWYSRGGGHTWHVARMGFSDGTLLDFRPRPHTGGPAGSGDLAFQRTVHAGDTSRPPGQALTPGYQEADWVLTTHQGKLVARKDTWVGAGAGGADLRIVSRYGGGRVTWSVDGGTLTGSRSLASRNQFDHHQYFDRESYRDYTGTGRQRELVREYRVLADNTAVVAWKVPGTGGAPDVWRWNKVDRHGNVMAFGTQDQRVRVWFDDMRRWEDRVVTPTGHTVVQELPAEVGGAVRRAFNDRPLRVREYFPDAASLTGAARTPDNLRGLAWREFESGAVARRKTALPDGTFLELESMAKHWRRWGHDATTGEWKVLTERSVAGYVRERPAPSFAAADGARYAGDLGLVGRETYYIGHLNEFRGFERMYRQPRRTPWGPGVTATGESAYTPFAVRNVQHMLVEFSQEFVLDFAIGLAIAAALPGEFGATDVAAAALRALVSGAVKGTFVGLHNLAAHHSQFRVGLNWQDRGFPYRFRQDDDDWAGEWASNEFVLRWRGGAYDFVKDGFVVAPLGSFLGSLAAIEAFGVKDAEGEWQDVSVGDALALSGAAALGTVLGSATTGLLKAVMANTAGARWYHRQGVVDFVVVPIVGKLVDKPLAGLVIGPEVRDWLDIAPPAPPPPPPAPDTVPPPETTTEAQGESP